ncbi:hypothetical protein CONPUDRAFT_145058 [Coniophora puteana RWD-64-598 SS2]|uniref:DNA/RNA-binding domain-containing protein n=1 Tax=Coniophora puteana (strain RWD-64-598) TaxID=741705 RepID=A0A5M3MN32_CONPW|nr:uncharacterized protein CONPUDRAFT_145058 [Coniophora puteana RWD-64-598 SS2]EIW80021.1 hypothetical protein CONPUDRAFT_145058 [Coniophora puteana RWD-64-598 SS2]
MAESASHIAREASGLHQGLKELIRKLDPWDREVEFQRNNLRRHYLRLILVHPSDPESRDAQTRLWMQTSHQFISTYRDRLKALDHILQSAPRTTHNNVSSTGSGPRQGHAQGNHGPVEYRKLMQRFRQFLATEEKFWTAFVARCFRSFALQEAATALATLGILTDSPPETSNSTAHAQLPDVVVVSTEAHQAQHDGTTESVDGGRESRGSGGGGRGGGGGGGRSQNHFPPEDSSPPAPQSAAERASRIADLSKALVYLGDLARYRELYNESGGRPKAGHEDNAPARRGRNRRRGGGGGGGGGSQSGAGGGSLDNVARARDYSRAIAFYEQARLLVPSEGNPSNQLAILAQYQRDWFTSLYHHYKALCVRRPFETAADNMRVLLSKQLKLWRDSGRHKLVKDGGVSDVAAPAPVPVPVRLEQFKEQLVLLHASWQLSSDKFSRHVPASGIADEFASLVSERHLLTEVVSKVIILAQGALWKHRMIRDPAVAAAAATTGGSRHAGASPNAPASSGSSSNYTQPPPHEIESRIATHVLDMHRALLRVGIAELAEAPPDDAAADDLAQLITATFRRTLPALRIANKWLVANGKYVVQHTSSPVENGGERRSGTAADHGKGGKGGKGSKGDKNAMLSSASVSSFWATYARFFTALAGAFPMCRLKALDTPLEEDVDMRGFLPLRGLMYGEEAVGEAGAGVIGRKEGRHPNDEMLMRIWDLLSDAEKVAEMENSPVTLQGRTFATAYTSVDNVYRANHSTNNISNGTGVSATERLPVNAISGLKPNGARAQGPVQKNKGAGLYSDDPWQVFPVRAGTAVSADEDAMTNRTDEDIIREAISAAVDRSSVISTDEEMIMDEEDEIVWDPRTTISPQIAVQDRSHPQSPISPMLSPKTPHARVASLSFGQADAADMPAMLSMSSRSSNMHGRPPSGTTAEDLLNNVMGLGLSRNSMGVEQHSHALPPPNSPPRGGIWGEPSIAGQQNIWSVSLGGGGSPSTGLGGVPHHSANTSVGQSPRGHGYGALRQGHPGLGLGHTHTMSYSHSPSQSQPQQSIWAPAFESTQNGPVGQQQQQQQQQQSTRFASSPLRSPPQNVPLSSNNLLSPPGRHRSFSTGANTHYSSGIPSAPGLHPSALSPPRPDLAPPGWPPAQNAEAVSPARLPLSSPFMAQKSPPSGSPLTFSDPAFMTANPGVIGGGVGGGAHYGVPGNAGRRDAAARGDGSVQYGLGLGSPPSISMDMGAHHQRIPTMFAASPIWSKHG